MRNLPGWGSLRLEDDYRGGPWPTRGEPVIVVAPAWVLQDLRPQTLALIA